MKKTKIIIWACKQAKKQNMTLYAYIDKVLKEYRKLLEIKKQAGCDK